jgi:RNA polymerase sigma-70 factor (ECF subfamily)
VEAAARQAAADLYRRYRPLLFAIAYRMTGSATEAEDLVQEAFLRYQTGQLESAAPQTAVRSPKAYLTTVLVRLCLDHLQSARVARERYTGPWLPEPVLTAEALGSAGGAEDRAGRGGGAAPAEAAERRETLSLAFLVLLERLTPQERAVFVLHEAFGYAAGEVGAILGKSAPACRQLLHRARERLAAGRLRFEPSPEAQRRLTERFIAAAQDGNLAALTDLLTHDVTLWSDGGGKAPAVPYPLSGQERIARFWIGLSRNAPPETGVTVEDVNGALAILLWRGSALAGVVTLETAAGRIAGFRNVLNPDKLARLERHLPPAP